MKKYIYNFETWYSSDAKTPVTLYLQDMSCQFQYCVVTHCVNTIFPSIFIGPLRPQQLPRVLSPLGASQIQLPAE